MRRHHGKRPANHPDRQASQPRRWSQSAITRRRCRGCPDTAPTSYCPNPNRPGFQRSRSPTRSAGSRARGRSLPMAVRLRLSRRVYSIRAGSTNCPMPTSLLRKATRGRSRKTRAAAFAAGAGLCMKKASSHASQLDHAVARQDGDGVAETKSAATPVKVADLPAGRIHRVMRRQAVDSCQATARPLIFQNLPCPRHAILKL